MKPRDSQRSKLYKAERAAFGLVPEGAPEVSPEQVAAQAAAVLGSTWVREHFPRAPRSVEIRPHRTAACAGTGYVRMSPWARRNWWVLLHELAHVLIRSTPGWYGLAAHGREFAAAYLGLVRELRGEAEAKTLKLAFRAYGVKFTPKRQLTPEQRAALRERAKGRLRHQIAVVGSASRKGLPPACIACEGHGERHTCGLSQLQDLLTL
jgi:putative metallohydrolase (TIGR04338 family)